MSMVMVIGPGPNETHDDYLIDTIHKSAKGKEEEKVLGNMILRLMAISELGDECLDKVEFDENDSRLVTAVYSKPESVHKDLELTNYGVSPLVPYFFPVIDSFSVVGGLDGKYVGFGLDFFTKDILPTRTRAFIQSSSKNLVQRLASEIFRFKNTQGEPAYIEKHTGIETIDLEQYEQKGRIKSNVCEGELRFGGERGKPYNEVVLEMMDFISQHPHFNPEKYILRHYDFKIDFDPKVGKAEFSKRCYELMERIQGVFEKKAQRYAA